MRDRSDTFLEALLADTLAEQAGRVTATVTAERVRERLDERRLARRRARTHRPLLLLGLAALLLLPLAALIVGRYPSPVPPGAAGYEALFRRSDGATWSVVAVRADGEERQIASVPIPNPGDDRRRPGIALSDDGWLATPGATGWEFRDLHGPGRTVGSLADFLPGETGHAWIGDGRFVTWDEAGAIAFLDPAAGTVRTATVPGPLTDVIGWTADGSALVTRGDWGTSIWAAGVRRSADWGLKGIDGAAIGGSLAELDLGWHAGDWWRDDGSRLQLCDMSMRAECPGLPNGAVVVESPDGALTTWYRDELAPADIIDAAFGGTGMWLMADDRTDGRRLTIARVGQPGDLALVTSDLAPPQSGTGSVDGVAPDDSLLVVYANGGEALIDGRTGHVWPEEGDFLGFVPSGSADTWSGDRFRSPPAPSVAPSDLASSSPVPAYPSLPPIEELISAQLMPGDRELWREDHVAVDAPASSPSTVATGPIDLDVGIGILLVCSGPSDVLVTMQRPDASAGDNGLTPLLSRCLDGTQVAGGYVPSARIGGPVTFSVTAAPDTAWQLVIYDPAPGE